MFFRNSSNEGSGIFQLLGKSSGMEFRVEKISLFLPSTIIN
jgi:hypothetical protein